MDRANVFRTMGATSFVGNRRNLCLYENGQAKVKFSKILIQRKRGTQ